VNRRVTAAKTAMIERNLGAKGRSVLFTSFYSLPRFAPPLSAWIGRPPSRKGWL